MGFCMANKEGKHLFGVIFIPATQLSYFQQVSSGLLLHLRLFAPLTVAPLALAVSSHCMFGSMIRLSCMHAFFSYCATLQSFVSLRAAPFA